MLDELTISIFYFTGWPNSPASLLRIMLFFFLYVRRKFILKTTSWVVKWKGITRCEPPNLRSIKHRTNKWSKQLVSQAFHILRHAFIALPSFPNQFIQPKRRFGSVLSKTQETPKDLKTKCHKWLALSQWINKWSTDMMKTRKSSRKKKIKYTKIQELWSSFDVGPS